MIVTQDLVHVFCVIQLKRKTERKMITYANIGERQRGVTVRKKNL